MAHQKDENKKETMWSGWPQFNTQKRKMVSDFAIFKDMSENRPTETDKGKYAEALFRDWLGQFLPAKYGVTSGYIISQRDSFSPRAALKGKLRHYDVIIYNKLESPILWTEISPDHSLSGNNRAIPAEYVHAVLEVKSSFNAKAIADAFKKLDELAPFLELDNPTKPNKEQIPANFFMGIVFFDLPKGVHKQLELLNRLMPTNCLRGFCGGIVLSAEGLDQKNTGHFWYVVSESPLLPLTIFKGKTLVSSDGGIWSDSIEKAPGEYSACIFNWTVQNFAIFAFQLISIMNGTYDPAVVSSWHGLNFSLGPKP